MEDKTKQEEIREGEDPCAYQKRYIKEELAPRAYGDLLIELDGNDFTIININRKHDEKSTNRIPLKGWEAKRLSVFIEKYYVPSQEGSSVFSSRLSRTFPEHLPHHGSYPPGKPPDRSE